MRLSPSDLIPLLVIMGSGAVGVVSSAALVLWMSPALASAPVPAIVEAAPTAAAPLRESAAPVRVVLYRCVRPCPTCPSPHGTPGLGLRPFDLCGRLTEGKSSSCVAKTTRTGH